MGPRDRRELRRGYTAARVPGSLDDGIQARERTQHALRPLHREDCPASAGPLGSQAVLPERGGRAAALPTVGLRTHFADGLRNTGETVPAEPHGPGPPASGEVDLRTHEVSGGLHDEPSRGLQTVAVRDLPAMLSAEGCQSWPVQRGLSGSPGLRHGRPAAARDDGFDKFPRRGLRGRPPIPDVPANGRSREGAAGSGLGR